jgi:hypothetical protein
MSRLFKAHLTILFALLITLPSFSQTFRGSVTGVVLDAQGAVIPDATVQLTNPASGQVLNAKTGKAGEFNFPELNVGTYQLTVTAPGFQTKKIDAISVEVTKVTNIQVPLTVGAENTVVDVTASGVSTDTTTSSLVAVIDSKSVQEMPMNGRNFTQMMKFTPGNNISGSVNGTRTSSINYQVDGTDNVDSYLGNVASNQGGIAGIAGGLIPIEAIDQFSVQSNGEADMGRNAGANQNMVLKSGTNNIHGDVFYFDRNEFFAAISPVAPLGSRKPLIRNHQGGFTLGGPLWKDHTFLFTAGEIQVAKANSAINDTVINDAWLSSATGLLSAYGLSPNRVSTGLYNLLYPADSKSGPAGSGNYFASAPSNYKSYNGVIKLDHHFNDKETLSIRYLGTTGTQSAPYTSDYAWYFQTVPMRIHNFSVVQTSIFNSNLLNQITLGTNYFLQSFNDANQSFNPAQNAGLNLGLTGSIAAGAPTINITGFDQVGATQPSGRVDVTGHISDALHWTIGRHALKIGGEFRHGNVNLFYFTNSRGTFTFDGTRGPWNANAATLKTNCANLGFSDAAPSIPGKTCSALINVADFLNGQPSNSATSKLLQGNSQRVYLLNTEDFWFQDDFQANKKLNINYGIRYTIPGVVHDAQNDLTSFVPGQGFVLPLYHNYYAGVAPRFGFSFSPLSSNRTVLRGAFGLFYDVPPMSNLVSGTNTNGGDSYTQNNPAGPDPAINLAASGIQFQYGINPFTGTTPPQFGAMGVNPNIRMPYVETFSLNIEQQLTNSTLLTIGYVGTQGRRLLMLYDLNQPVANGTSTYSPRPYQQTSFPGQTVLNNQTFAGINQVNSSASSNYNGLQITIKQAAWHGIVTTANYSFAHSLDNASSATTPMNSYNLGQDYGNSTFDTRHSFNGFVYYNAPQLWHAVPRFTKGWQVNGLFTLSGGVPLNPLVTGDPSRTFQVKDRPNLVTGVNPYVARTLLTTASGRQYVYLNKAAFVAPAPGTYGNVARDTFYGPGFGTFDFSLFKHTPITERVMSEFRVECFNLFNHNNLANPSVTSITSGTFGQISNTRNGSSAPGLGVGEPRNVQFALKLTF